MTIDDIENMVCDSRKRLNNLKRFLKIEDKLILKKSIDIKMLNPNFWINRDKSKTILCQLTGLKSIIDSFQSLSKEVKEFHAIAELTLETKDEDLFIETEKVWHELAKKLDKIEFLNFLSGKYDRNSAYLSIHAGAGGTESCDWGSILLRMYRRWIERKGWNEEVIDYLPGDEAGIKSITLLIKGSFVYGYSKAEKGIHRLVRISPFDSNSRRHTSFASVDIMPEIEENDEDILIDEKDLKIDTYRSSGAGGQHVNKTDSAIRITHLPSKIIVSCQRERSQHKNRATAIKMLKARLLAKKEEKKRKESNAISGEKIDMGWGSQIRSYVLHPYQMVKDLRTNIVTSNVNSVLDGDIDIFITSWLKQQIID